MSDARSTASVLKQFERKRGNADATNRNGY